MLGVDEVFDVGMIAAHGAHHGAAPRARRHDGAAHRIPHIHEAQGARGVGADAHHGRALRPERREIMADAAALLHGECGFLQASKMPSIESSIRPMTKQLKRVTLRPVPAPARMRPAGRNLWSAERLIEHSPRNARASRALRVRPRPSRRGARYARPSRRSARRRHRLRRYFMSQMSLGDRAAALEGSATSWGARQQRAARKCSRFVPIVRHLSRLNAAARSSAVLPSRAA